MPQPAPPKPTASELELLRILWQLGPATARQVHDAIGAGSGKALILAALRGHVSKKERDEIQAVLNGSKDS
jgi:predicted transcriptional regulator